MLLFGELASKEGVGEEDKIVFEILIMIADRASGDQVAISSVWPRQAAAKHSLTCF